MSLKLLDVLKRNKKRISAFKNDVIKWLIDESDDFTHEVTLTFPFPIKDRWHAEKVFKKYKSILIDRCFRKNDGSIKMAVVLEGDGQNKLYHYHCAIRCPSHMSIGYFSYRIESVWQDTVKNEYVRTCIKKYTNKGWLSYITKEITPIHTAVISEHTSFS